MSTYAFRVFLIVSFPFAAVGATIVFQLPQLLPTYRALWRKGDPWR